MSKIILFVLIFLIISCTHRPQSASTSPSASPMNNQKDFNPGEVILANQLLTKIFDEEMGPLKCVSDKNEASLLLRTLRPRMEIAQDDLEAGLDSADEVNNMIKSCQQTCTCHFIDELFREHQVTLNKTQLKQFTPKKSKQELNRCMAFIQNTFCEGELFKSLDQEKIDFSFDE